MKRAATHAIVMLLFAYCAALQIAGPLAAADPAAEQSVRLVIDYNDGLEKHFTAIPWKPGLTVFGALQQAAKHPRGIKFESTGSGATLFILSLDGIKNQAGDGDRNWIFSVNDKKGNKSSAVTELKPGDTVRWKYDVFEF